MNRPNHVARWIAAGASVLAFAGAGTVAATTEPPDTTAAAEDTSTGTGAGPSNCPAITEEAEGTAAEGTEAAATEAAGTEAEATEAAGTEAEGTDAATETTGAADASAPPMTGPTVQIVETDEYGPILVDGACFTLYGFTPDADGEPTCVDDCAANWPPVFVADEVPPLADELDPTLFSVVEHPDGPMLKIGDWPLYYFAGDTAPGDINGQGVGGVWWVVAPDGTLIETEEGGEAEGTEASEGTGAAEGTEAGTEPAGTVTETTSY